MRGPQRGALIFGLIRRSELERFSIFLADYTPLSPGFVCADSGLDVLRLRVRDGWGDETGDLSVLCHVVMCVTWGAGACTSAGAEQGTVAAVPTQQFPMRRYEA